MRYLFTVNRTLLVAAVVWLSYSSNLSGQVGVFQEYPIQSSNACPVAVAIGPDGALWSTNCSAGQITRITSAGLVSEYSIPTATVKPASIVVGPDGALWFTETNDLVPPTASKIGRITTSGVVTEYSLPDVRSGPAGMTTGLDGALWFTEEASNRIGRITTAGSITEYSLPTGLSQPVGITTGADGAMWFTEWDGNKIGRITTSGAITEYPVPTPAALPSAITTGSDGSVWFLETAADKIGRITTAGVITEYALPASDNGISTIVGGPDGALWFTEAKANRIGRITTAGLINEYAVPTPKALPSGILTGPGNVLWFTEPGAGKIGRLAPNPPNTIQVTTNLAAATFTLIGPSTFTGSGKLWAQTNAPAGQYTVVYGTLSAYNLPVSETKTLTEGGTLAFGAGYDPKSPLRLHVTTNLDAATFSVSLANKPGEMYSGNGKDWAVIAPAGCYKIVYAPVAGYRTPAPRKINCSDSGTLDFSDVYSLLPARTAASGDMLPSTQVKAAFTRGLTPAISQIPPTVHIEAPAPGSSVGGTITVAGWALDNATVVGSAIGSVQVLVDGAPVGSANYGVSRPDVCSAFPGRPGCPNVGFTFQLNTSTLTAGQHTITVSATDTDTTPDTGTASVTVTATGVPPSVYIDAPSPGSVLSGSTTVSGWALDNSSAIGTAIGSVQVKVDGTAVGTATYGGSRPDVCSVYPGRPGCPNVGFSFQLNLAALSAGSHTITVSATDTDGTPDVGTASVNFTVPVGPPSVDIDTPAPGTVVNGVVVVSGWALDNTSAIGTAINNVQIKIDGTAVGTATYGTSRPDVCAAFPGRPGCPNVGFTYSLNTATLSSGSHMLTVTATDSDTSADSGSWSETIQVGVPPSVVIDTPAAGSTISGTATLAGWAIDNTSAVGTAISSVQVKVDGTAVGTATYGVSRPDVCAVFPGRPGCPNVGYSFALNTATLTPGTHTITVTATDSDGSPDVGSATITVKVSGAPPSVAIDTPAAGSTISGTVTLAGWAIDNTSAVGTAISSVQVKVDGTIAGTATYGVSRPDVCSAFPGRPGCPNVGYSFALNTATLTPGSHTITVIATDSDGTPDSGSATITVNVPGTAVPPTVYIDSPAPGATVSSVVTVSGWALDNATAVGTAISSVKVKVDGTIAGTATYGISRPDVCSAFPGRPGCPNVGYSFSLNTAALTPGTHTLMVAATDSDGTPDTGSASISIVVPSSGSVISVSNATVGQGLQVPVNITFAPVVGLTAGATMCPDGPGDPGCMTVTTNNPSLIMLKGPGNSSVTSFTFPVPAGTANLEILVQAVSMASAGTTATITASFPGYGSSTATITYANSGIVISGPNGIGGSFNTSQGVQTTLTVFAAQLDSSGLFVEQEEVISSTNLSVPIASASPNIGTVSPGLVSISGGTSSATVNFAASGTNFGATSVMVTQPAGFTTPVVGGTLNVNVQQSQLIAPSGLVVGKNLQVGTNVSINGNASQAVAVTLQSLDSTRLLFACPPQGASPVCTPANGASSSSITVTIPQNSSQSADFFVRAYDSAGSIGYTISAPGLGMLPATIPLAPSGFAIQTPGGGFGGFSMTNGITATLTMFTAAFPSSGMVLEAVAGDQSVSATVTSGTPSVGTIGTSPVVIAGGASSGTTTFNAVGVGSANITASATGYTSATVTATVLQKTLSINNGLTIGQHLEASGSVNLSSAAPAGGVPVTLTVDAASNGKLQLAVNPTDAGSNTITVTVPQGQFNVSYWVYALASSGTATYTATAPGYGSGPDTTFFAPSAVILVGGALGGSTVSSSAGPQTLTVITNQLTADGQNTPQPGSAQPLAGNVPLTVMLGNSNPAAGTLSAASVTIAPGATSGIVTFTPLATGNATISVTEPTGWTTPGPFVNFQGSFDLTRFVFQVQ